MEKNEKEQENKIKKSFFFDRFVMRRNYRELMISIGDGDKKIKELAGYSGMAYQHLCNVLQEAQKEGFVKSEKKSNAFNFNLTKKGEVVKDLCLALKMCIEDWNDKTIDNLNKLGFIKKVKSEDLEAEDKPKPNSVIKEPNKEGETKDGNAEVKQPGSE